MKRVLAALLLVTLAVPLSAREGFGFKKKAVEMTRTIPPGTNAGARRVRVNVEAARGADSDDAAALTRYISDAILAGAGTLAESGKPEVTVEVSLDRVESHESWETYTDYERRQTGTKQEWNESKQKYETKPVYSNVAVQKQRKVLTASLTGSFEIADKSRDVASGTLDDNFRQTYGDYDSAPAPSALEEEMLKKAARSVASQLVPTQDRVSVLLPRSTFEPFIAYAQSGDWQHYLSAVQSVPENRNPKDEAFRQYAIGVAKEALGYKTDDRNAALALLREAQQHYQSAVSMNPGEELFRSGYSSLLSSGNIGVPLTRLTDSVAKYERWTPGVAATTASRTTTTTTTSRTTTTTPAAKAMRNQTVIELAKAGLADDNIILAIDGAQHVEFDVTPDALIALSKAGVSKTVIAYMQKRMKR
ncbi:MAG TPA: hypothetical protein VF824_08395 [Thermoanaerobaculia bacterium]|jgi:hypothetical protein